MNSRHVTLTGFLPGQWCSSSVPGHIWQSVMHGWVPLQVTFPSQNNRRLSLAVLLCTSKIYKFNERRFSKPGGRKLPKLAKKHGTDYCTWEQTKYQLTELNTLIFGCFEVRHLSKNALWQTEERHLISDLMAPELHTLPPRLHTH